MSLAAATCVLKCGLMIFAVMEMREKTMTDAELIKALRCCSNTANIEKIIDPCTACPVTKNRDGEYPNWCDISQNIL